MNNRDKIIEVTFLLSLKNGFDRVPIKQIQEESGLSAGSIYYYFKDKDDILVAMINKYLVDNINVFKEVIRNSGDSLMDKLKIVFICLNTSFNKNEIHSDNSNIHEFNYEDYFVLLTSVFHQYPEIRSMFHEIQHELNDFYCELLEESIEKGEIRDDIDIKTLNIYIQSIIKGHITLLNQSSFSLEEIIESNLNMIWDLIKKEDFVNNTVDELTPNQNVLNYSFN